MRSGWQCPLCYSVFSPDIIRCPNHGHNYYWSPYVYPYTYPYVAPSLGPYVYPYGPYVGDFWNTAPDVSYGTVSFNTVGCSSNSSKAYLANSGRPLN